MRKIFKKLLIAAFGLITSASIACTNYLVTKGASTDGSTIISYAADSHTLFGELYFRPAADYPEGTMIDINEWDTGKYLGKIKQAKHTFSVVGNMNEHQLAISETTFGGRDELVNSDGILDYGSLIYITLQRAKTAREAIKIMTELVNEYGYHSSGESISIADGEEIWILEIVGKGKGIKGANWVALMVPDGYVSAHANQARITTFPIQKKNNWFDKKQTCFHDMNVIKYAREKGYISKEVKDKEFSFSDTYAPVDFGTARACEIRVWTMFNQISPDMNQYWEYAKGNITHDTRTGYANNRMPLWIKPSKKVSAHDVMMYMRDHLEGTELDMAKDPGAGPFGNPYRWRPLTWEYNGQSYLNERATATQQTGFSFIAQSRSWLPSEIGGILWFGVDDAASSVYFPVYCGTQKVPHSFAEGNGSIMKFSETSAFWIFNQVSNWAYTRYNVIHPEIAEKQAALEKMYFDNTPAIDAKALALYKENKQKALDYLTEFTVNTGDQLTKDWKEFYQYLFVKYSDGNVKIANPANKFPDIKQPGYDQTWKKNVIEEAGEKLKVKGKTLH